MTRADYEAQGYSDMRNLVRTGRGWMISDCTYTGWRREAWQRGAWRHLEELRAARRRVEAR